MGETYMDLERERIAEALEQQARSLQLLAASIRTRIYSNDPDEPRVEPSPPPTEDIPDLTPPLPKETD